MKKLLRSILIGMGILLTIPAAFAQTHFTATLTGDQVNPAVGTDARGTGVFVLTEDGLEFNITVQGIEIANAHFHTGAIGANGGVARGILEDFEGNTASGIWSPNDAQPFTEEMRKELLLGNFYINIHTAENPGGEIRGQVLLSSGTAFTANLTGTQVNPEVATDAKGTGFFTLTEQGLVFSVTIEGLEISNAHFHNNAIGVNGGAARGILDDFNGKTASGVWTSGDDQALTDELIKDLLLGNIYLNIHTADNPGGEIRGQINLSSGIGFSANLDGDQEVPAVTTAASGTASFTLTDAGLVFFITADSIEISNAHFHLGAAGEGGGPVRGINTDFVGNTASGVWSRTDDEPLSIDLISELLLGNIYVNLHSTTNPGGEIRGQLIMNDGLGFTAKLNGDQVNPPIATEASGTGAFVLTEAGLAFSITVEGLEISNAHFHNNAIGANGGVARGIQTDFNGHTASGIWTSADDQPLTDEMIADLVAGNLYINVHTADNPGGEIRGQVILSSGTGFSASLNGDQVNTPITTEASGTGTFTLSDAGLAFYVTVDGLTVSNAHFHSNAIGANGGVARGIFDDFVGNTASGLWTAGDAQAFTDEMLRELVTGNLYLNIHTAENPGGEIRGQVVLNSGTGFSANLMGDQEVPAVNSTGTGTGAFTWTDAGLVFNATVDGLVITNAHLHNAPFGESGGPARGVRDEFIGNTVSGIWTDTDSDTLTNELMSELVLGNIYLNIHTAENPGGEIRGQLSPVEIVTSVEIVDEFFGSSDGGILSQNAPNPFSQSTEIRFSLRRAGHAALRIFNISGKEIATLVNEDLIEGTYKATFNPSDLAPGIYIYRLDFDGQTGTKKMLFQK